MTARKRDGRQFLLRFAEESDLRDRLHQVAKANNRTLTQEILYRLEASLADSSMSDAKQAGMGSKFAKAAKANSISRLETRMSRLEQRVKALESGYKNSPSK